MWCNRLVAVVVVSVLAAGCSRSRTAENEQTDQPAAESTSADPVATEPEVGEMTCDQICEKNLELSYREGAKQATKDLTSTERKNELRKAEMGWVNRRQNKDVMRVLAGCVRACGSTWSPARRKCEHDARDFPAFQQCLKK